MTPPPGWLLVLSAVWSFTLPLSRFRAGPGTLADIVMFTVGPAWCVWLCGSPGTRRFVLRLLAVSGLLTALCATLSSYHAEDPGGSRTAVLKVAFGMVLIFLTCLGAVHHPSGYQVLAWSYVAGCLVLATSTWTSAHLLGDRAVGFAENPVEVGTLIPVAMGFALFLPLSPGRRCLRPLLLGVLASSFATSLSLTGVVASVCAIGLTAVVFGRITARTPVVVLVAAVGTSFLTRAWGPVRYLLDKLSLSLQDGRLWDTRPTDNTVQTRLLTIRWGWERVRLHPILGNGLDDAGRQAVGALETHDVFVLSWQTGGILLVGIMVAMALTNTRALARVRASGAFQGPACHAATIASWVGALTGPDLYQRPWLLPIMLSIALGMPRRQEPVSRPQMPRGRTPARTTVPSGTSCETTAPAPTTPWPDTVTPRRTVARAAIQAPLSTTIGPLSNSNVSEVRS
jgi:hypothetical protein